MIFNSKGLFNSDATTSNGCSNDMSVILGNASESDSSRVSTIYLYECGSRVAINLN